MEGENEVSSCVVQHQRGQRVIVIDRHSLAIEDFLQLGRDDLVRSILDYLSVQGRELYHRDRQCVSQRNLMSVDEVVSHSANRLVILLLDRNQKVASQSIVRGVALANKPQSLARLHSRLYLDLLLN